MNPAKLKAKLGLSGPPVRAIPTGPPRIPDHELLRCIGQGSYGEVWLARTAVGTFRAVKVVFRDRFKDARPYEREFAGIQKYEPISRTNEGLVDVLQIGRNEAEGYFYYVMELADDANAKCGVQSAEREGGDKTKADCGKPSVKSDHAFLSSVTYVPKTLAREIQKRSRLSIEECITLGLTLNLALGHLHKNGLIHRDVKPSNVIFVNGVPKLADIGLVTDLGGAESFVGTEGFMPPEGPNSPQADLYALGKVLYEASMGKDRQEFPEPYTGLSLNAESDALMELNAILLKACALSSKQRYPSAEEMNVDLALLHSGQSVRNKHTLQRRLKIANRIGVTALAVIVLGAVPYYLALKEARLARVAAASESQQRKRAEASELQARAQAAKSQQVARFLKDMLSGVGPSVALGRDTTMLREILNRTANRIGSDLGDQPEVQAELMSELGAVYDALGEHASAESMQRQALTLYGGIFGNHEPRIAEALTKLAGILVHEGKRKESELLLREALTVLASFPGQADATLAVTLRELASVLGMEGKLVEAEAVARQAVVLQTEASSSDERGKAAAFEILAEVLNQRNRWAEAKTALCEARSIRERFSATQPLELANTLGELGKILLQEKPSEAETVLREALEIRRKILGNEHREVSDTLNTLGIVLRNDGKLSEAETVLREALAIDRKIFGDEHPSVAGQVNNLAMVLKAQGKLAEAEAMYRQALAMSRKLEGYEHPHGAITLHNIGIVLWMQGKLSEAEQTESEAVNLARKVFGPRDPYLARFLDHLAVILRDEHKTVEAEPVCREGLAIRRNLFGNEHFDVAGSLETLGTILQCGQRHSEAETAVRESMAIREARMPGELPTFNTRSLLGDVLLAEKKYSEAESLLLSSHDGLNRLKDGSPFQSKSPLAQTIERLVHLYERTDRPELAATWKQKLSKEEKSQGKLQ